MVGGLTDSWLGLLVQGAGFDGGGIVVASRLAGRDGGAIDGLAEGWADTVRATTEAGVTEPLYCPMVMRVTSQLIPLSSLYQNRNGCPGFV